MGQLVVVLVVVVGFCPVELQWRPSDAVQALPHSHMDMRVVDESVAASLATLSNSWRGEGRFGLI